MYHSGQKDTSSFRQLLRQLQDMKQQDVEVDAVHSKVALPPAATPDDVGYELVKSKESTDMMATFIRALVHANHGKIVDERKVQMMARYHSGEWGSQTFPQLMNQLCT